MIWECLTNAECYRRRWEMMRRRRGSLRDPRAGWEKIYERFACYWLSSCCECLRRFNSRRWKPFLTYCSFDLMWEHRSFRFMVYVECLSLLIFLSNNTDRRLWTEYERFRKTKRKAFLSLLCTKKEKPKGITLHFSHILRLFTTCCFWLTTNNIFIIKTKPNMNCNQTKKYSPNNQTKHFAFFKSSVQPSNTTQIKHQTVEQARSSKATSEAFLNTANDIAATLNFKL